MKYKIFVHYVPTHSDFISTYSLAIFEVNDFILNKRKLFLLKNLLSQP